MIAVFKCILKKSHKVVMMMKAAKPGWAGAEAGKEQGWSRSRAGQEQGRSRNRAGAGQE